MHAVGRGSQNVPVFINLKYHGNEASDKWVSFVGKGVCFDSGGLNIKPCSYQLIFSFWNERYVFR
jgi:leucyl aminopeptidase